MVQFQSSCYAKKEWWIETLYRNQKQKQTKQETSNQLHLFGTIWTPVSMSLVQGALQRVGFIFYCDLCTHTQKCYLSPDLFVYQESKFMEDVPNLSCLYIYEHISVVMN